MRSRDVSRYLDLDIWRYLEMQILQNVMGYFHHLPPQKSTKTLGSAAAMARPPGLVSDGVSWPEVVALQAQVKSKEL